MKKREYRRKKSTISGRYETEEYARCKNCINRGYIFIRCAIVFSCRIGRCKK